MTKIENDCVDCGLPCLGNACPYVNVEHTYCDICGEELSTDEIMSINYDKSGDLCDKCYKKEQK